MSESAKKNGTEVETPKGYRAHARRSRIGDWQELKTLKGGYKVRPQKFSTEIGVQYRTHLLEKGAHTTPHLQRTLKECQEKWHADNPGHDDEDPNLLEVQQYLSDEDWSAIISTYSVALADVDELRLLLLHGIAESTLDDPDGNPIEWGETIVEELLEFDETAREIAEIAQRWNAPLPKERQKSSSRR